MGDQEQAMRRGDLLWYLSQCIMIVELCEIKFLVTLVKLRMSPAQNYGEFGLVPVW